MDTVIVPPATLAEALRNPIAYPHAVQAVSVIETHISWVFLAGEFAYKVKKPVKLPFVDFSTLEARRFYCEEELRLNRRTAPQLYLGVVAIAGDPPAIGGAGEPIDYAVKMRRFAQEDLLRARARKAGLDAAIVDALAARLAELHAGAAIEADGRVEGARRAVQPAIDNFTALAALEQRPALRRRLALLRDWTQTEARALAGVFAERHRDGFVRECHGDLHLGNVALIDGEPVIFDALEFSLRLRRCDVMGDVAFLAMDLAYHRMPGLAARFVNAYLERTGDYAGVRVLRFYLVYRAMVRAKVERIRAGQAKAAQRREALASFEAHLKIARALAGDGQRGLFLMHGPSGSGKTHVAQRLLEALGAVRLRSDIVRKQLAGATYSRDDRRRIYVRLAGLARLALHADFPVIVDATFLDRVDRDLFGELARQAGVPFHIVSCEAPLATLRERVRRRALAGSDASEATASVVDLQLGVQQRLGADEMVHATVLDTTDERAWRAAIDALARGARAQRRANREAWLPEA